jgi:hypothetical protein
VDGGSKPLFGLVINHGARGIVVPCKDHDGGKIEFKAVLKIFGISEENNSQYTVVVVVVVVLKAFHLSKHFVNVLRSAVEVLFKVVYMTKAVCYI